MRHNELLDKYWRKELLDYECNGLVDFFQAHTHCSWYAGVESKFISIPPSIIQGSAAGPVSYVATDQSDLRPLTPGNSIVKFADDISWLFQRLILSYVRRKYVRWK